MFYQDILGIKPREECSVWVAFELPNGIVFGLWSRYIACPRVEAAPGASEISFLVDDVDQVYEDWGKKHVTIAQMPENMGLLRSFVALDPDGHRIRIYKFFEDVAHNPAAKDACCCHHTKK